MTDKSTNQTQRKRWSNLSPSEKRVDKNLREKPCVNLPNDKGSEFCLIDEESYTEEALHYLYRCQGDKMTKVIYQNQGLTHVSKHLKHAEVSRIPAQIHSIPAQIHRIHAQITLIHA